MSKLKEASHRLYEKLCPHGPGFKPEWLNGLGVTDYGVNKKESDIEKIVIYGSPYWLVERALQKLDGMVIDDTTSGIFWWEGFTVEVKECGPMQLLSTGV